MLRFGTIRYVPWPAPRSWAAAYIEITAFGYTIRLGFWHRLTRTTFAHWGSKRNHPWWHQSWWSVRIWRFSAAAQRKR